MKLHTAKVIGLNSDQRAALAVSDIQDDQNAFLAILQLSCDDAFTKGRQVLLEVSDFYFDFEGTGADKIKATFEEVAKKFDAGETFDLLIASISGKILYLIGHGEVDVFLKREGKVSSLFSIGSEKQLVSGFLTGEDKLLFSTKNLANFLREDLPNILDLSIENFEEEVSNRLSLAEFEDQGVAGLLVEIESEEVEKKDEVKSETREHHLTPGGVIHSQNLKIPFKLNLVIIKGLLGKLTKILPKKVPADQYLDYEKPRSIFTRFIPKSGKGKLILAALLILLVIIFTIFQYQKNKHKQKVLQSNQLLQQAKTDFESAKSSKDSNPNDVTAKLNSAKDEVNKAIVINPKNEEAKSFKNQIEQESGSILQQFSASNFPLYLDLDLIKKNFRADKMSLSNGKLLLLDSAAKTLITIDLAKKNQQTIAGADQLGDASMASLNGGFAFVFSQDKGVIRVDITNQKVATVSKKDKDWGEIKDLYGFGSNIYLLDTGKNQIWKYLPASEGYADKKEYLNNGVKADLANSIRMQIESSIYILKSTGEILRFTKGDKDNFSYSGLPSGVKDSKSFFVSSDTDNLYLLDSGNSRLLVLTKTGTYKAQYQGDKFATATDLVVDEVGKKIYLLDSGKIYTSDLK